MRGDLRPGISRVDSTLSISGLMGSLDDLPV